MKFLLFLILLENACHVSAFVGNQRIGANSMRTSGTCLFDSLEPLAEEGTWQAFLDEEQTGLVYYFDTTTGESLWEPPTDTFPRIRLPRKKQRLADDLRRKYRKSRQLEEGDAVEVIEETEQKQEPSWIAGLFDDDKNGAAVEEEVAVATEEEAPAESQPKQKGFFKNIFGENKVAEVAEEVVEEVVEEEEAALDEGETVVWKKPRGIFDSFVGRKEASSAEVEEAYDEEDFPAEPVPLKLDIGSFVLPHPAKVRWGGEDAVFVKGRTFGVFDGVSGADKLDGVPLYSRTLADEMKKRIGRESLSISDLTACLTDAADYADVCATGASTAVVASIGENGFLQALNVGDSYCVVVRGGRITAKTREISHYWECPYQLSDDSPDRPKDGTKLNVELIRGDLVIMGSDGIFDNVEDDLLLDVISKAPAAKPQQLAKKICDLSRKQSLDRGSITPYSKQAQRRGDPDYRNGLGGKVDDSSCVVVLCK